MGTASKTIAGDSARMRPGTPAPTAMPPCSPAARRPHRHAKPGLRARLLAMAYVTSPRAAQKGSQYVAKLKSRQYLSARSGGRVLVHPAMSQLRAAAGADGGEAG